VVSDSKIVGYEVQDIQRTITPRTYGKAPLGAIILCVVRGWGLLSPRYLHPKLLGQCIVTFVPDSSPPAGTRCVLLESQQEYQVYLKSPGQLFESSRCPIVPVLSQNTVITLPAPGQGSKGRLDTKYSGGGQEDYAKAKKATE